MENKKSKSEISQAKINRLLKKYKIREFKIKLDSLSLGMYNFPLIKRHQISTIVVWWVLFVTDNDVFRKAIFEKYRISDCVVRLDRKLPNSNENIHLAPEGSIRSKAICFPSSVLEKSSEALTSLATYREEHSLVPFGNKKNVTRVRTKSMFANRDETADEESTRYSLEDLNTEFRLKFSSPNRGLKPIEQPAQKLQQPLSQWQIIQKEFQNRIQAKHN